MQRPPSVTAVAVYAALGGFWGLLQSSLALVAGFAAGANPVGAVVVALAAVSLALSFARIALAGGLFKLVSFARPIGIAVFALLALLGVVQVVLGESFALIGVALDATAAAVLFATDAFDADRPAVPERSVTRRSD